MDILAERESVGLNARIEKFDFERAVGDRAVLLDELIQTLLVDDTLAVGVSVGAMIRAVALDQKRRSLRFCNVRRNPSRFIFAEQLGC